MKLFDPQQLDFRFQWPSYLVQFANIYWQIRFANIRTSVFLTYSRKRHFSLLFPINSSSSLMTFQPFRLSYCYQLEQLILICGHLYFSLLSRVIKLASCIYGIINRLVPWTEQTTSSIILPLSLSLSPNLLFRCNPSNLFESRCKFSLTNLYSFHNHSHGPSFNLKREKVCISSMEFKSTITKTC